MVCLLLIVHFSLIANLMIMSIDTKLPQFPADDLVFARLDDPG